jgi:hypothetical protein
LGDYFWVIAYFWAICWKAQKKPVYGGNFCLRLCIDFDKNGLNLFWIFSQTHLVTMAGFCLWINYLHTYRQLIFGNTFLSTAKSVFNFIVHKLIMFNPRVNSWIYFSLCVFVEQNSTIECTRHSPHQKAEMIYRFSTAKMSLSKLCSIQHIIALKY